jgi:hypothetical protein
VLSRSPNHQAGFSVATARIEAPPVGTVALAVGAGDMRAVHQEIARRLRSAGITMFLTQAAPNGGVPSSVERVFAVERLVAGARAILAEKRTIASLSLPETGHADLTVDFSGHAEPRGRTLRILYDGVTGEAALMAAVFTGRMPSLALQDTATGEIVSNGVPGVEDSSTVLALYEAALAGVVTLVVSTVRGWGTKLETPQKPAAVLQLGRLVKFEVKSLAHTALRQLYRLCCYTPHWRVCWRFVPGADLWETQTLGGTNWQVLPDPGTHFYADPFPIVYQGRTFIFVEDLDHRTNKGVISVIPFGSDGPSGPACPVLEEPWHLSYPFVFERDGQLWMIPESSSNRTVTLYRAERFPDRWVKEADLLTGIEASDATLVDHDGKLWMFASVRDGIGSCSDRLSIFHASALHGPWEPHPGNPVVTDQRSARPAGAFVRRNGRLLRPVQDCSRGYGTGIGLAEVTRLDTEGYSQVVHATLEAPPDWPGRRFHTLNRAGQIEVIDGAAHSPRSRLLARRLQAWSGRRDLA